MSLAKWFTQGKTLFETRNLRERGLVASILLVLTLWLFSVVADNTKQNRKTLKELNADLESQAPWLAKEAELDTRMQKVLSRMDASKTYSSNQLLAIMDEIARKVDLKTTISRPNTRRGEVFTEHVMTIPLDRVDMETLIDFENLIKTHSPYLGVDYLLIEPMPRAPELLRGELRVTSYELNPS